MSMQPSTASLHAGLIQRARPAAPATVPRPVVPAPASDDGDVVHRLRQPGIWTTGGSEALVDPRVGLTVRVAPSIRARLHMIKGRTGRTVQSLLHEALLTYLSGRGGRG